MRELPFPRGLTAPTAETHTIKNRPGLGHGAFGERGAFRHSGGSPIRHSGERRNPEHVCLDSGLRRSDDPVHAARHSRERPRPSFRWKPESSAQAGVRDTIGGIVPSPLAGREPTRLSCLPVRICLCVFACACLPVRACLCVSACACLPGGRQVPTQTGHGPVLFAHTWVRWTFLLYLVRRLNISLAGHERLTLKRIPSPETNMGNDLTGKVSLITGGSRGIGRACCHALAQESSSIAVNYLKNKDAADSVVAELQAMGVQARAFQGDVSDGEQADRMMGEIMNEFQHVDVLVNNAGITQDRSFMKMTRDQWHKVLLVNLDGPFNMCGTVLPGMCERKWGRIINITSIVGQMGNFGQANYAVTKGGLVAFTKTLAREVAAKGVTLNAVAPGFIETDMTSTMPEKNLELIRQATPMGRLGRPEEVARAVRFLSAPQASFITGQVISINGGLYM